MSSSALAQETRQEHISQQQSVTLVKNLLRTAVSSIAYVRNLFPEECFTERRLTGVTIRTLLPRTNESELLINWLEKGVFDALDKSYLSDIVFAVYSHENHQHRLVECYQFHVDYPENSDHCSLSMESSHGGSPTVFSKEAVRDATVRLIRTLVTLTQTLAELPSGRYITIKLQYRDHVTPPDYEPQFFRAGEVGDELVFDQRPYRARIGTITTQFHAVNLKLQTVADTFDEPAASRAPLAARPPEPSFSQGFTQIRAEDGPASQESDADSDNHDSPAPETYNAARRLQPTAMPPQQAAPAPARPEPAVPDYLSWPARAHAPLVPADKQPCDSEGRCGVASPSSCLFNVVAHFVLASGAPSRKALLERFPSVGVPAAKRMLAAMAARGLLVLHGNSHRYSLAAHSGAPLAPPPRSRGGVRATVSASRPSGLPHARDDEPTDDEDDSENYNSAQMNMPAPAPATGKSVLRATMQRLRDDHMRAEAPPAKRARLAN